MTRAGWRERVSPWDAWVAFVVLSGLAVWLVIDHNQYPQMALWVRLCIAAVLVVIGLWFAIVETVDAVRRNRS
jgi:heme/copper-type cytochrome/quinol oxidase subunit 4